VRIGLPILLLVIWATTVGAATEYVWWEGEAAVAHNFSNTAFGDWLPKRDGLSGGIWLNHGGDRGPDEVFARYEITVPAARPYQFWTRKFWKHGPFRWRFDQQPWRECGRDIALADTFEFQTHICANWVHLGQVELPAGAHTLELRLLAKQGENATACFDAFLLTPQPFTPRGKLKPGEKSGQAAPGWWAFEPDADPFRADAVLDLRPLNEKVAGQSGFVRADGHRFRLGNGRPVRFWGVNVGPEIVRHDRAQVDYLAARLAKVGVNLVRVHGPVYERGHPERVDPAYLDRLFYFVSALKRQGIYTALSFYFPLWIDPHPFAQIYFEAGLQQQYRAWAKTLLATPNPHTGRPLAREPAVALIELVNEDSLFFWTFQKKNLPPAAWVRLEKSFGGELLDVWHLTRQGLAKADAAKRDRVSRQVRFLAELQRTFYAETKRYLREELGARSLVVASNWKTADEEVLGPIERYTYTAGDVIDRHGYFGGQHTGPRASYAVSVGDVFASRAAVREPAAVPLQMFQYNNLPQIISEIGWTMPNRYRADNTFLCSAYASLQDIDGFCLFAVNSPGWAAAPQKFPVSVPSVLGQFPAAALQYRRGDVAAGGIVSRQQLDVDALYRLRGAAGPEPENLDQLRKTDVPAAAPARAAAGLDWLVGRLVRSFVPTKDQVRPSWPTDLLDPDQQRARSVTGELVWEYGRGVVTVNTPRSQGAAGFLGAAGPIRLGAVTIECGNEYAAIQVISLDSAPLASARQVLLQAFTEERPFGWNVDPRGKILDVGGPPLNVRNIEATVSGRGPVPARATALDAHGYAVTNVPVARLNDGWRVVLPADALYTVLER